MIARKFSAYLLVMLLTASAFAFVSFGARADQGVPDQYGYYWTDSNVPDPTVGFNWVEISGSGTDTMVSGDDDYVGPLPIGFDFRFYGNTYSMFNVSTNGLLQFDGSSDSYHNSLMPNPTDPDNIIAPYWDDLCVDFGGFNVGTVYYETVGTAPNQQLVVEFYEISLLGDISLMTFEVILNETGEIWFQYLTMNGVSGLSASVGIEGLTGMYGCEYSYDAAVITDGLAVMFDDGPVGLTPCSFEEADWGSLATHTLKLTNAQAFTDSFDITYTSLEGWAVTLYDSTMTPLVDNGGDPAPDTGDLAPDETFTLYVQVEVPGMPSAMNDTTFLVATSTVDTDVTRESFLATMTDVARLDSIDGDYAVDTDSDDDFDTLVVEMSVVSAANTFLILEAELFDGLDSVVSSYMGVHWVAAGTTTIEAEFDGEDIYRHMSNGPYYVDIYLSDEGWNLLDEVLDYETAAYLYDDFDPPAAMFLPPHEDSVIDDDMNWQYDYLVVTATVFVSEAGSYLIWAEMYDVAHGWYVSEASATGYLDIGTRTIDIMFPALDINQSGLDGPYVAEMELYSEDYGSYFGYDEHATSAYLYDDFEGPRAVFVPPYGENVEDTDSDGYYNTLTITAFIDCLETALYDIEVSVYSYDLIASVRETLSLTEGLTVSYNVVIDSETIWWSWYSGEYYAILRLFDNETQTMQVSDDYLTSYYYYDEFDPVGAYFDSATDAGRDTDYDTYYNEVVVTVVIDPISTGYFRVIADVYDYYYWLITVEEDVYLEEDVLYDWEIVVPGEDIVLSDVGGYLYLELYIVNEAEDYVFDNFYYQTTEYYYLDDFDPIGANFDSASDAGRDTDSDGYYNEVVVTVVIDPISTGYFTLQAYVYDDYYSLMSVEEVVYLEEGVLYDWEIVVPGEDIVESGIGGYLYLDMYLLDESETYYFDYYYYQTSEYYYLDLFDRIGAYFEPPHDDYGRDDDSDGYYDYLVVTLYVNASSSGYYRVTVDAYSSYAGYFDYYSYSMCLVEGERTAIEIEIESARIWEDAINGYWYFNMYVGDYFTYVNYDWDYYETDYYYYLDFDPPGAVFGPPHSDYALDTDEDGYYDYLVLEVALDCNEPGEYTVHVDLLVYGLFYTDMSVTEHLTVGNEVVEFYFEGWMIWRSYITYNNFEARLSLEDEREMMLDYDVYYTASYDYWDFEPPPAEFSPPHSDYAVDMDEDGLFDGLVVNASVETSVAGEYIVVGELYDWYSDPIDAVKVRATLAEGEQVVQLWFDAWPITMADYGPYQVHLVLYDVQEVEMDSDDHFLSIVYDRGDFDPTPPSIESGWAYDAPMIDGSVAADEWFGATVVDVSAADSMNDVATMMYVMNNGTHLFVLIDAIGDLTESVGDTASISFDTGNDELTSDGHEDQFVLEALDMGALSAHCAFDSWYWDWEVDCSPFDPLLPDHTGLAGAVGFGPSDEFAAAHRVYELCIPLALLMVSPGDDIGFAGLSDMAPLVWDTDDETHMVYSTWPVFFWNPPSLNMYGDLVLSEERPLTTVGLSGDEGEAGWFVSEVEVTLTASGGTGGVADTWYEVDGDGWISYADPFVVDADGEHTVRFYSTDVAGNEEPVRTVIVGVDTVAPETVATVSGTEGEEGWWTSEATVTFTVTDASSGFSVLVYRLDGGDWADLPGVVLSISDDGEHTLQYYSVDVAGLEEALSSVEIKVDIAAPVTAALVDGSRVTLSMTDGNGSGVSDTVYRIDDGDWTAYEGEFEVTGKGTHTLEFYSVDVAGNNETVKSLEVQGSSGYTIFGLDWWMVLLIGVIIILISIGVVFGMRRAAKDSASRMVMKDYAPAVAQMMDDPSPVWPPGQEQTPPAGEEPPPPEEQR